MDDGFRPSERLRSLELHANEVFDVYRGLYYGKAMSVSSVYLWDKEDAGSGAGSGAGGFAGCFLVQNRVDDGNYWNSIHVVDAGRVDDEGKCRYELTTTLLLSITPPSPPGKAKHSTNVSGSLARRKVRECKAGDESSHIANIGKMIEDAESEM